MAYIDEQSGLEVIPLTECVHYLETFEVARLGYVRDGHVYVYPINYVWDGESIVFRSDDSGSIAAIDDSEVVIELDGADMRERTGWSVIARGVPHHVDPEQTPELAARLRRLAFYPWVGGEKEVWLRVIPAPLTGRRVGGSRP